MSFLGFLRVVGYNSHWKLINRNIKNLIYVVSPSTSPSIGTVRCNSVFLVLFTTWSSCTPSVMLDCEYTESSCLGCFITPPDCVFTSVVTTRQPNGIFSFQCGNSPIPCVFPTAERFEWFGFWSRWKRGISYRGKNLMKKILCTGTGPVKYTMDHMLTVMSTVTFLY